MNSENIIYTIILGLFILIMLFMHYSIRHRCDGNKFIEGFNLYFGLTC